MALTPAMKAAGRKTPELLAQVMKEASDISIRAVVVDASKTTFVGEVSAMVDNEIRVFSVAQSDGRKKTYSDVDSFAAAVMTLFPQKIVGDLPVTIVGAHLLTPKPRNISDIIAEARKQLVKFNLIKTKNTETLARINSELVLAAAWETGTPDEQLKFAEMKNQQTAVTDYAAWVLSEIARITAALPPV
ncbi:hypothetical protein [Iodobacter fluviatilis]|uniref:Uncharacterized protein n=1 Tax=Iodobacter fluviatilis TaxID=537 RepID=A0A377Q905_9NEIS|nr:hypothetical protein [Iodobacter fluviatilis]TCU88724.1 hypothetical protein EV682_103308 [Iodobacter fluviatilis]STQ91205.1 Uncharacterised protein [Iodobacter fluviatilis]